MQSPDTRNTNDGIRKRNKVTSEAKHILLRASDGTGIELQFMRVAFVVNLAENEFERKYQCKGLNRYHKVHRRTNTGSCMDSHLVTCRWSAGQATVKLRSLSSPLMLWS